MRTAVSVLIAVLSSAAFADNPPKSATAPAKPPASIFDFGLEPLPNDPAEKPETDTPEKPQAPAADQTPSTDKPSKPVKPKGKTPRPDEVDARDAIDSIHISTDGVMTTDRIVTLGMQGTTDKHFIAEGDFYAAPEPTPYGQGQIYFRLRQISGTEVIILSITRIQVKRILFAGKEVKKFAYPVKFDSIEREKWQHFRIEASDDGIAVQLAGQKGDAKGPTETGGTNCIVLGPGAKLRNLKVTIVPSPAKPVH